MYVLALYFLPPSSPSIIELKVVATAGLTLEDGNHDDDEDNDNIYNDEQFSS